MHRVLAPLVGGAAAVLASAATGASAERAPSVPQSAARPGDEQMTCDAIIAEMKTLKAAGVSAEHRAEAKAAAEAMRAEQERQQAAATGQMAALGAATAAASGAAAAGAQGADAALLAAQGAAEAQGMANKARMKPLRERVENVNAAARADLHSSMQANPRFGRLIELAVAKGCSGNF